MPGAKIPSEAVTTTGTDLEPTTNVTDRYL